ncbi:HEAT repeat domain-containing protein [Acetivibrio straminisolvens]|jgi:hypothetical protein|uniref:HEAT domain protein n=1 Tax=Acetivibrio straminisolvens JCM 21531 TaxID=1294263 RepID=W4V251_9FIRM|nr:hypothetical protein [Acetivibrio straminisolvens]GAE87197.1 HEAT domain protein [Acetivibrio straminisolvens JCM 21531]
MDFQQAVLEINTDNKKVLLQALKVISRVAFHNPNAVETIIADIKNKLHHSDEDICSYACWTAGQIGRNRPEWYSDKIRENALFALGWIGRADPRLVESRIEEIIHMFRDKCAKVRHSMIWASENIANTKPEIFEKYIDIYESLLDDPDTEYVRGESPEFFRVMGKSRPDIVERSIKKLEKKLEDEDRVTRIHAKGALKVILKNME